jgi:NCS2 family nucleobase:cation symporter-2/xanthine permease XanP
MAATDVNDYVRYEPDEIPPRLVTIGSGIQAAVLILAPVVLTVVIVSRISEQSASFIAWAVFAALIISGVTTILQAVRVGRFGSGHVLMMGTSGAFIAVCVAALKLAGPATMASLIVISSLLQFFLAARLSWLRRIFTPIVTGTVIMLIAATVMPIVFATLADVPEGSPAAAAPVTAVVTMVIVAAMVVRASPAWRLWSPIIAIAVGCIVSIPYGIYDFQQVLDAPWIGIPFDEWPGFDVTPGVEFWALLPAFIVVTLVGAIETIGDGVAIQRVSRRNPRATDFRVVQGALNADGVGNLLSGILGTVPNTTYSSSISLAEVTGIAARRVGVVIGVIFVILAFFPKVAALLIAIPSPVAAAYVTVLVVLLFVQGMRIVINDGMDYRKAVVVGLSFWIGTGFQGGWIFADQLGEGFLSVLLSNGMTAGAIVAILIMLFIELTRPRRRYLQVTLENDSLPKIEQFLLTGASKSKWNDSSMERLTSAGEEMLAILLQEGDSSEEESAQRKLNINLGIEGDTAQLEYITSLEGENLEDHLAYLNELPPAPDEREVSFRLLWHYASSVQHQKYHGLDIITVTVAGSR